MFRWDRYLDVPRLSTLLLPIWWVSSLHIDNITRSIAVFFVLILKQQKLMMLLTKQELVKRMKRLSILKQSPFSSCKCCRLIFVGVVMVVYCWHGRCNGRVSHDYALSGFVLLRLAAVINTLVAISAVDDVRTENCDCGFRSSLCRVKRRSNWVLRQNVGIFGSCCASQLQKQQHEMLKLQLNN